MVEELRSHQWPSDKILARLDILDQRFARVETILVGMPDTDERGIVGDVHELFRSRNDCEKDIAKIRERCNMEHGKDPGGKRASSADSVWEYIKSNPKPFLTILTWIGLVLVAIGGAIATLGDRFNIW